MAFIPLLSSPVRDKSRRHGSRRAAARRPLRFETLERRLTLSTASPTAVAELLDDVGAPVDSEPAEATVALQSNADAGLSGVLAESGAMLANALDGPQPTSDALAPPGVADTIEMLLAETRAVLSRQAAADDLRVCHPLQAAFADRVTVERERLLSGFTGLWNTAATNSELQTAVSARVLGPYFADFIQARSAMLQAADEALAPDLPSALDSDASGLVWEPTAVLGAPPGAPPGPPPGGVTPGGVSADPVLSAFTARAGTTSIWVFEGEAVYSSPSTLTVEFTGEVTGSTSVNSDGTFSYSVLLPPGTYGIVNAVAVTPEGVRSNVLSRWIG